MRKPLTLLLAFLGLFDSLYLLWIYTSPTSTMVCLGTGCDTVRLSAYSHMWGVPMPVFGAVGYLAIALLIVAESLVAPALAIEIRYALAGATGFGFLFSLYLEYLQGMVIHAWCPWCITSGVIMTAMFALAIYNVLHPAAEGDASGQLAQVRSYYVVFVAALAIGIPAFQWLSTHGEAPPPPPPAISDSNEAMLVRPDSHATGNLNSPVTVVEFGDFECPVCGREEPVAEAIRSKYGSRVRFVFRQFPLRSHPFAQRMAEASECAADQGKFWEAVSTIYAHQDDLSEDALKHDAAAVGLDMGKFNQCMDNNAEAARVQRDRKDGLALGVVGTPTFFIGRQVASGVPDVDDLSRMIDHELEAQGSASAAPGTKPVEAQSGTPLAKAPAPGAANPANSSSAIAPAGGDQSESGFGSLGSAPGGALTSFQTGITCSEDEARKKQPTQINTAQLRDLLSSKPLFVDVRTAKEFAAGSIPGAINLPVDDMPKRWNSLPKNRIIVFFESGKSSGDICASGRAAGRILLENGYAFEQVKVYQDGLAGWQKAGLSTGK